MDQEDISIIWSKQIWELDNIQTKKEDISIEHWLSNLKTQLRTG